jgi:hypothetical protein
LLKKLCKKLAYIFRSNFLFYRIDTAITTLAELKLDH